MLPLHRVGRIVAACPLVVAACCGGVTCSSVGSLDVRPVCLVMSVHADRVGLMCLRCRSHAVAVFWWLWCCRPCGRGGTCAVCRCHRVNVASACLQQVRTYDVPDIVLPPARHCVERARTTRKRADTVTRPGRYTRYTCVLPSCVLPTWSIWLHFHVLHTYFAK